MTEHALRGLHERNDDKPEPTQFAADVVCSCFRLFASEIQPSAKQARDEALALHAAHVTAEEADMKPMNVIRKPKRKRRKPAADG